MPTQGAIVLMLVCAEIPNREYMNTLDVDVYEYCVNAIVFS